jgi:HlyD family type I secretion membrane fusion protein
MPLLLPSARNRSADLVAEPISAFESETQAVIQQTSPYSEHAILHVLAGAIFAALLLTAVVKLDRVVTSAGRVLPAQGSFFVQPLDRALVTSILVHPGDVVRKGQVLATFDPTFAQADLKQLEQQKASGDALVARLKAEQADQPYLAASNDPASVLQASIWTERQAEFRQSVNDFDARIRSDAAVIARSAEDAAAYRQRLDLARQVEQSRLQLQQRGFGSKLSLLSATDSRVDMERMLSESQTSVSQAQSDLDSLKAQRAVYAGKWRDDVATQLVTAQSNLDQTVQSLAKASKLSDLTRVVAPSDAVVLKIGKASIGSVIDSSASTTEPLFTLTPVSGNLDAEVRIDAKDIGFIRVGDPVRIKLDAYRFTSHGAAAGVVKSISEGSFTTSDDGQVVAPYYKALVTITNDHLRNVPANFHLIPGLTVVGDVVVGRRTILSYLIEGALRTGSEAMREP